MKRIGSVKSSWKIYLQVLLFLMAVASLIYGSIAIAQETGDSIVPVDVTAIPEDDMDSCIACHDQPRWAKPVKLENIQAGPHKDFTCQSCHASITGAPHTPDMMGETPSCADCHPDEAEALSKSTHANEDKSEGDHPTCTSCHDHDDAHAVKPLSSATKIEHSNACSRCHDDADRMGRYGVDAEAVSSYKESFHGRALLKFGKTDSAVCTDCHGYHDVLSHKLPESTTHPNNVAKTCSQEGCHAGAQVHFAMSGANHLRVKIKHDPILGGINWFFRALVMGVIAMMLVMVGFDLWYKIAVAKEEPRSGRPAALLISISFAFLLASLGLLLFEMYQPAAYAFFTALGLVVLAYLAYLVSPKPPKEPKGAKSYVRFNGKQRAQHALLALSFLVLVLTGMPQRFAQLDWLRGIYNFVGGFDNARLIHRGAALVLITVFMWHAADLLVMWKRAGFKFRSWTMIPNRKDAADLAQTLKLYTGRSHEEPKFDRYQFRQKMDYLAEYWGVPIMVLTGIMLWFPIYWGNMLPDYAISAAIVAHGWEATLAFLAIVTWHIYNEFLNPDAFPSGKMWVTGSLTEGEMLREHPLELGRIRDAAANADTLELKEESGGLENPPLDAETRKDGDSLAG